MTDAEIQEWTPAFEEAAAEINEKINKTLSNDELKELYALFKQGSVGDVNTSRPGMLDIKGKIKWDAWASKKGMTRVEGMKAYIQFTKELFQKHGTR
ncbi:acyl-CoA-binding protein homolog 1 [Eurytemora carolleeae]|uniref:acyl-CoA-binding protein homolog 1 n=1 Tax=Eurytemora carolleeae TaxID=1294199 RepID=UPI000C756E33|nr:acyl-CoA-binding protein homolog 1 [Eurytemora carolleeae]|eukprot:XP_023336332.1 acyl-CoA-binding protein homolog 1-like [Eurytemora affinis]